jgi:dTDP-4-dehydrorhamnose reductase
MKILVTGKSGQLASSLVEKSKGLPDIELVAVGRPELDLTDPCSISRCIDLARPDVVVSAAAYTAVDRAEDEPVLAHRINAMGAEAVASAAEAVGATIIHLSTDYVFSGDSGRAYDEGDETFPRTVYGLTKLDGERGVARTTPRHVILRTSWVYSPFGTNFVKTMLKLARDRPSIDVVADQWGNPSSALDIATAVLRLAATDIGNRFGTYHLAGQGDATWADLARHVFEVSRIHGGPFAQVNGIPTAFYPTRAIRPMNSRLCCAKARDAFGVELGDWRSGVGRVVQRLVEA